MMGDKYKRESFIHGCILINHYYPFQLYIIKFQKTIRQLKEFRDLFLFIDYGNV